MIVIIISGHAILSFSFVLNFVFMPWTRRPSQNRINTLAFKLKHLDLGIDISVITSSVKTGVPEVAVVP